MVRVRLSPDQRRSEIVAAAQQLFTTKGYAETTISDIVKAVGVAQGTFYWYFSSKEQVLNAVVEDLTNEIYSAILSISESPELSALQKFDRIQKVFFVNVAREGGILEYFHRENNRQFHDQFAQEIGKSLTPVFIQIIKQGVDEGIFDTPYPEEAAVFILAAFQAIHDDVFSRQCESISRRKAALLDFVSKGLGCKTLFGQSATS